MTISRTKKINGTSLIGYISASLQQLKEAFGDPCYFSPSTYDKTQIEWRLLFEDGTIATIYDWKRYGVIPNADEVVDWNIGGKNHKALELVQEALKRVKS